MKRFSLNLFVIFMCWTSSLARHVPTGDINTYILNETKSYMDTNESPCHEFYYYACKHWRKTHNKYPDVGHTWGSMYSSELMQMLEDGLTKSDKPETKEIFNKLHDFYDTCKNQKEDINLQKYLDVLKPTDEDDWPHDGESWNPKEKWSVWKTMGRLARYGFNNLLVTFHLVENHDLQTYTAKFEPHHLYANERNIVDEEEETYDEDVAQPDNVKEFLSHTSGIFHDTRRYNLDVVETNIDELKTMYKNMDMYLSEYIGAENLKNIKGVHIANPKFFEPIMKLIEDTPQDVLIQALKWSLKYYLSQELPEKLTDRACTRLLKKSVPLALEYVYEQEIYSQKDEHNEDVFEKIFLELQTKLANIIRTEHKDLSKEQIADYAEKSLKMKLKFGRLPQGVDDQVYVDYFQSWEVVNDNFYRNHVNILKRLHFDSRNLMHLDKFKLFRPHSGLVKNTPYYITTTNIVSIPFSYTFHNLADPNVHELFIYSDIGTSLARAMLHGFNLNGVKYDKDGVIFNRCSSDDLSACLPSNLEEGQQCVRSDPNNYLIIPDEHIADFSGFRVAYDTYFQSDKYSKFSGDPELNDKQLFAVKFGQTFGHNRRFDFDNGRPNNRLNLIVGNSAEFNELFSCDKPKTKMCQIW